MSSIELIRKYGAEQLDEVLVHKAVTSILEGDSSMFRFVNAKTVLIPSMTMDGLGDYSRTQGFPKGSVNLTWEPYTLKMDRGTSFTIDSQTDEETAGLLFGKLATEFVRTKVAPEVDAYRLSTLLANAQDANITKSETLTEDNVIAKFNADTQKFEELGIEKSSLIRFISYDINTMLKNSDKLTKKLTQEDYRSANGINFTVTKLDEVALIPVPKTVFKTLYTFLQGDTDGFGFEPAEGAVDINFLTVHLNSAIPVKKHEVLRVFNPAVNQSMDAWLMQYRLYHDIFTPKQKQAGITASIKGTYTAPEGVDASTLEKVQG